MLTDTSGTMWQLTGDESQLSANVNKQVEVMGTASTGGSAESHTPDSNASGNSAEASGTTGSASASANANGAKTLAVTTVRKVADSCSTGK